MSRRIRHVRRILIVKPSSMGDIMHTFRAVQLLAETYPKAVFDWVVNPEFEDLLSYSPVAIADIIHFKRKQLGRVMTFVTEIFPLISALRRYRYDLVIDFQGLLRSALLTWITRHKHSVGFADPREPAARHWYHRRVKVPDTAVHAVDRNLALAGYYCDQSQLSGAFTLPHDERNLRRAYRKLEHRNIDPSKGMVAIFPGARWASKTFPAQLFADLINGLHEKFPDVSFLVMGSISENAAASAVLRQTGSYAHNLVGATRIGEMVELIRLSHLAIANDSGPLHIADTMEVPAIGFFGATDPAKTGPRSASSVVFQREVPCKNCLKRECDDAKKLCFKLPFDEILDKAAAMLSPELSKIKEKTTEQI